MITLPTARPLTSAAVAFHFDTQHAALVAEISDLLEQATAAVDAGNAVLARELLDAADAAAEERDTIEALWSHR